MTQKTGNIIVCGIITALIATTAFAIGCNTETASKRNIDNLYPKTAVVVNVDCKLDTVTVEDSNGNLWDFYGCEDWQTGDICSMLMDTNGTESIYDDAIISTRYNGTLSDYIASEANR